MTPSRRDRQDILIALGIAIRDRRKRLGLSQKELAERSTLHVTYISELERGVRNPSAKCLAQLAEALELSFAELAKLTEQAESSLSPNLRILLVEDNPADVQLIRMALSRRPNCVLDVVPDGRAAMDYLLRTAPFEGAKRPELILLDLNLPKMSGREVLSAIKSDANLKSIPVVVLTTSSAKEDVEKSYELQGNCFVTKPVGPDEFNKTILNIQDYWFGLAKLPHRQH